MTPEQKKTWNMLSIPADLDEVSSYGDLIPIDKFLESVDNGCFIDYDGYGYWSTTTHQLNDKVYPSRVKSGQTVPPQWATHVSWMNR